MDKGTMMQGTHEKARVFRHVVKYGLLCTVRHFAKIWPDCPLKKELFEVGRIGVITKFQLQQTIHPCKCGIPHFFERLQQVHNIYISIIRYAST